MAAPAAPPLKTGTAASTQSKPTAKPTMANATELIRAMWTGDPGKGKTYDMAHMAKLGHVIYLDAERRLKPGVLRRAGIPLDNIEPRLCTEAEPVTYTNLQALALEMQGRLADGEPIVGMCWDSAVETARLLLGQLVDQQVVRAERQGKERDSWKTFQEDYGDLTEQMRRVIRKFRDLPIHLAIAASSKRDQDEEGAVRVSPALTPAVLRDYLGYMDLVIHKRVETVNGEDEYSGLTRPTGRFEAKDAFGVMPRVLVNPTFDRVLGYVNGTLDRDSDPLQIRAREARKQAEAAEKTNTNKPAPAGD